MVDEKSKVKWIKAKTITEIVYAKVLDLLLKKSNKPTRYVNSSQIGANIPKIITEANGYAAELDSIAAWLELSAVGRFKILIIFPYKLEKIMIATKQKKYFGNN